MTPRDLPSAVLQHLEERELSALLRQANEAVAYMDDKWVMRYCNDVYLANVGLPRERVIGHTPSEYQPNFHRSTARHASPNRRP